MLDGSTTAPFERTRGRAVVALNAASGGARLARLAQCGSAKAMLPRVHSATPEVVFLNTGGGLTGGDELTYAVDLGSGAHATATTQTAERAYASLGEPAEVSVDLSIGANARLDWLPQETILFDRSHLSRRTTATLERDAKLLLCEAIVLGRSAMGEALSTLRLKDRREVRRDGRPVFLEQVAFDDAALERAAHPAVLDGARAMATVAWIAQGAEDAVSALRALPEIPGARQAVSGWDGRCVFRVLAADGWPLRRAMAAALTTLRGGPLPRVWQL